MDIAKAQTLGGGNWKGVDRLKSIGGEELLRHQHQSNHIQYYKFGEEWRLAANQPNSKYVNPTTNQVRKNGHLMWRLDNCTKTETAKAYNEREQADHVHARFQLQQNLHANPCSDSLMKDHAYKEVLYAMSRDGYASINEKQFKTGLGSDEIEAYIDRWRRDTTQVFSLFDAMAMYYKKKHPIKKEHLRTPGLAEIIQAQSTDDEHAPPISMGRARPIASGVDAEYAAMPSPWDGGHFVPTQVEDERVPTQVEDERDERSRSGRGRGFVFTGQAHGQPMVYEKRNPTRHHQIGSPERLGTLGDQGTLAD